MGNEDAELEKSFVSLFISHQMNQYLCMCAKAQNDSVSQTQ